MANANQRLQPFIVGKPLLEQTQIRVGKELSRCFDADRPAAGDLQLAFVFGHSTQVGKTNLLLLKTQDTHGATYERGRVQDMA